MRTLITDPPFREHTRPDTAPWGGRGHWPARWVGLPDADRPPFVVACRKRFSVAADATVRVHVTADERYELWLDGRRVGRGSERGDAENWFFETYDLRLPAGDHVLVARVWALGDLAPYAQMTVRPGFLLAAEGPMQAELATGLAAWEAKRLGGYTFLKSPRVWSGSQVAVDGAAFPWGFEMGEGDGWQPAAVLGPAVGAYDANEVPRTHLLRPATLPAMMEVERQVGRVRHVSAAASAETEPVAVRAADHLAAEAAAWQGLARGDGPVTVPAHSRRRVILDLEDYYCAYPEMVTTGGRGSTVRLFWAEALYEQAAGGAKGRRDAVEGKHFLGVGDTFRPDGGRGRRFDTLWWACGRFVELYVETAAEPLVLERLALREVRYPLEMESEMASSDARLDGVFPLALRTLQACAHETYFDCPYYEQLMYAGDTRLEVLVTYCTTRDDRLPRKALAMFDASRLAGGLTQSRYPSRVRQVIAPFSLWWVAMVHDFAQWRGDAEFVRRLMPGVRAVLDAFLGFLNRDGLVEGPPGWNYVDWVPAWRWGIPPEADRGVSGAINWHLVLALGLAADLEAWLEEPLLAAHLRRRADALAERAAEAFWDEGRGLPADDLGRRHFSEHTPCLALLSGRLDARRAERLGRTLFEAPNLARATIYFTHYLFEVCRLLGRMDVLFERLGLWLALPDLGFKTTLEHPEPSRSDCHAWAAHPVYHYFATVLGVRPAAPGLARVDVAPQLGPLGAARGRLVHPGGAVEADLRAEGGRVRGRIVLPPGVTGEFRHGGRTVPLVEGPQEV